MLKNIEAKVVAAAAGAGAGGAGGGAIGTFLLWLLGVTYWGQPNDATHAAQAIGAVPEPVGALLVIVVACSLAVVGALLGGYTAPHTPALGVPPTALGSVGPGAGLLSALFASPTPPVSGAQVLGSSPVAAVNEVPLSVGDVISPTAPEAGETAPGTEPPDPVLPASAGPFNAPAPA